jgi:hypothetical protein
MYGCSFHAAADGEEGNAAAEQRENPAGLHSKVSSGIIGNLAGNSTDAGGKPGIFPAQGLTGKAEFLYKHNTMLSAIIVTAMAMCMHMMCMRTAVVALESSRSLDRQ